MCPSPRTSPKGMKDLFQPMRWLRTKEISLLLTIPIISRSPGEGHLLVQTKLKHSSCRTLNLVVFQMIYVKLLECLPLRFSQYQMSLQQSKWTSSSSETFFQQLKLESLLLIQSNYSCMAQKLFKIWIPNFWRILHSKPCFCIQTVFFGIPLLVHQVFRGHWSLAVKGTEGKTLSLQSVSLEDQLQRKDAQLLLNIALGDFYPWSKVCQNKNCQLKLKTKFSGQITQQFSSNALVDAFEYIGKLNHAKLIHISLGECYQAEKTEVRMTGWCFQVDQTWAVSKIIWKSLEIPFFPKVYY